MVGEGRGGKERECEEDVLAAAFGAIALVVTVGVAWAATLQCEAGASICFGTHQADTITGTNGVDEISALSGPDDVRARGGVDGVEGGTGPDTVRGGGGDDRFLWGGRLTSVPPYTFPDASDDRVLGGQGGDYLVGGFAQGGVDALFGGAGNDHLSSAQRIADRGYAVTKEVLDCGPGQDTVQFDEGLDVVNANCEERFPFPEGARAPEGTGLRGEPGELPLE